MGHYAGEMIPDEGKSEPIRPYIILECQTEGCHNKGNRWTIKSEELKPLFFHPGLIQLPVGLICDECRSEPVIVEQEWRVP